jgi:threonine/homoserine/homoserine lactone efflux protein
MISFILVGMVLGLSAGLAPGPLLTLVVSETLRHGSGSGLRVAFAPLLTDLPIVALSLVFLARLADFQPVLGVVSLGGAGFVAFLAIQNMRVQGMSDVEPPAAARSLTKGIVANFLSPYPYLFWLGVGAPLMSRALAHGVAAVASFVLIFYLFLVGSKVLVAVLVGHSRAFVTGRGYLLVMRLLGVVLAVLAMLLARDGLRLLGG